MGALDKDEFQKSKHRLDKIIEGTNKLAEKACENMVMCCRNDDLDARDDLAEMAGLLREAEGKLMRVRAIGGRIPQTRSGGT